MGAFGVSTAGHCRIPRMPLEAIGSELEAQSSLSGTTTPFQIHQPGPCAELINGNNCTIPPKLCQRALSKPLVVWANVQPWHFCKGVDFLAPYTAVCQALPHCHERSLSVTFQFCSLCWESPGSTIYSGIPHFRGHAEWRQSHQCG